MGSKQGFLDFIRKDFEYKKIKDRINNYDEFLILQNSKEMKKQAARCMDCDIPFCHALGCPIFNRIPEWIDFFFRGDLKSAYESLISTNIFPEITGRICPALCESACSLSINLAPVTIKQIELYIIEKAFESGLVTPIVPKQRKSQKVAVIGSGPSGISAAHMLNKLSYQVIVYEKQDQVGGILRNGIPNFKLPKWVLDRRIELLQKEGIIFETKVTVGKDIRIQNLLAKYDAVLLCIGAGAPRDLKISGRDLKGIYFALDYLADASQFLSGGKEENEIISAKAKNVLVIGGGDTGSDCVGTAIRQGAKKITQIEILPKPVEWTKSCNPDWPDYPIIFRTSSSHQEGCIRYFSVNTNNFIAEKSHVIGANCSKVEWFKDSKNKYIPKEIPDSEFMIEADLVILSLGFLHVEHPEWFAETALEINDIGNISTDSNYKTNISGMFAAGDAATGASLVSRCIYHGRQAAIAIDEYLE